MGEERRLDAHHYTTPGRCPGAGIRTQTLFLTER
jgi:hypothetical protein